MIRTSPRSTRHQLRNRCTKQFVIKSCVTRYSLIVIVIKAFGKKRNKLASRIVDFVIPASMHSINIQLRIILVHSVLLASNVYIILFIISTKSARPQAGLNLSLDCLHLGHFQSSGRSSNATPSCSLGS